MQEIVIDTIQKLIFSSLVAAVFAPIMIYLLYKTNQVVEYKKSKLGGGVSENDTNEVFNNLMVGKTGTPNIGGVLVWVVVTAMVFLLIERTSVINAFLVGFILFGLWGFIDVVLTNKMKKDEKFRILQEKFGMRMVRFWTSALISILAFWLLYQTKTIENIDLGVFSLSFSLFTVIVLGIIGHFAVYSAEITDGLDGLMIGIFGIIFTGMGALLLIQGQYEWLPIIGIILGVIIVDLYFNIPPARFFNGGPGAMTLGFGIFYIGVVTGNIIPYFIISALTWFIMSTSMIQIISMRFFKKRVFKIAPIHHHFQAIGWPNPKITMRFWLITMCTAILGVYIGLVL
jgi:phospho-N-acetylmuramoyl-pentapeptide-transferase